MNTTTKRTLRERLLIWLSKYTQQPILLNKAVFITDDDPVDPAMLEHFEALMRENTESVKEVIEDAVKTPDLISVAGVEFRYVSHRFEHGRVIHTLELYPQGIAVELDEAIYNLLLRKKHVL